MSDYPHRPFYYGSHTCTPEECGHDGETCPARRDRPIGTALADSVQIGPDEHLVPVRLGDPDGCGLPQAERGGDWMQTYTGRQYWPLDPRAHEVEIEDIAHHLSMLCRYCGACLRFYSVAEHSVGVLRVIDAALREHLTESQMLEPVALKFRLRALLHDAPEAYCHDLIRPIKRSVRGYDQVEYRNWCAILQRFNISTPDSRGDIKQADNSMLLAEQAVLMRPAPAKWSPLEVPAIMLDTAKAYLGDGRKPCVPEQAKALFLEAFHGLAA